MIATEAALFRAGDAGGPGGPGVPEIATCGCGQEIAGNKRLHCPRCGCCLR